MPITNYHLETDNPVEKVFYGRVKLENATSLLLFQKKGMVQQLMHNLKYKGHEKVGTILGQWLGHELKASNKFNNIDNLTIRLRSFKNRLHNDFTIRFILC